jgi:hypothetical protein
MMGVNNKKATDVFQVENGRFMLVLTNSSSRPNNLMHKNITQMGHGSKIQPGKMGFVQDKVSTTP